VTIYALEVFITVEGYDKLVVIILFGDKLWPNEIKLQLNRIFQVPFDLPREIYILGDLRFRGNYFKFKQGQYFYLIELGFCKVQAFCVNL